MVKPAAACIWALASGCSAQSERAQISKIAGGGNSAGFFVECLIERFGTPGW